MDRYTLIVKSHSHEQSHRLTVTNRIVTNEIASTLSTCDYLSLSHLFQTLSTTHLVFYSPEALFTITIASPHHHRMITSPTQR
ncbi:hypothetical protein P8452_57444 [Trifolium repens]|nr:hypothetical protein P8452_57444 [Trifolium repens]